MRNPAYQCCPTPTRGVASAALGRMYTNPMAARATAADLADRPVGRPPHGSDGPESRPNLRPSDRLARYTADPPRPRRGPTLRVEVRAPKQRKVDLPPGRPRQGVVSARSREGDHRHQRLDVRGSWWQPRTPEHCDVLLAPGAQRRGHLGQPDARHAPLLPLGSDRRG